jgi:hypothetical protein
VQLVVFPLPMQPICICGTRVQTSKPRNSVVGNASADKGAEDTLSGGGSELRAVEGV